MTASDPKVVAQLEQAIILRVGEPRYHLWFERHTHFSWQDGQLTVGVPNRHFEEWLQKTFHPAVKEAAEEVFGQSTDVRFIIDPKLFQEARKEQEDVKQASAEVIAPTPEVEPTSHPQTEKRPQKQESPKDKPQPEGKQRTLFEQNRPKRKRRWNRLDDFVVGPCNRVAHASALSVVEMPEEAGNPLVLYGSVGTGKTHLLEGIYAGLRRRNSDWRVCFVTAEDFTNRFVQAMRQSRLPSFRKYFRDCDALMLDDLHFLARKNATVEEFLHTLDSLQVDGKPVVVTCDCHPRLADEFPPELVDRLLGGSVWGLTTPDTETRLDILKKKSIQKKDVPIFEDVLEFLANQLRGNVRELEGALNSLRHYSRVTGRAIDVQLAREALADLLRHAVRVVQLPDIDQAVCNALRLQVGALQSKQRAWAVSHPRMLAMFLSRKHTSAAYSEIGQYFGGRNHSTAVAAEKKVRQWLKSNGELTLGERTVRVREVIELIERDLLK